MTKTIVAQRVEYSPGLPIEVCAVQLSAKSFPHLVSDIELKSHLL